MSDFTFKTAPLSRKVYKKYKTICNTLDINAHEATELAYNVLYDALEGNYDQIKLRLGQYVSPDQYPQRPVSAATRKPDFVIPHLPGEPDWASNDHIKGFILCSISEDQLDYFDRQPDGSVNVYLKKP